MFFYFTSDKIYPQSEWIDIWMIEIAIHVCLSENYLSWRETNKSQLIEKILSEADWEVHFHPSKQPIEKSKIRIHLENELDSIYDFIFSHEEYENNQLRIDLYLQCVEENDTFLAHIREGGKEAQKRFDDLRKNRSEDRNET